MKQRQKRTTIIILRVRFCEEGKHMGSKP